MPYRVNFSSCIALSLTLLTVACGGNANKTKTDPLLETLSTQENIHAAGKFINTEGQNIGYVVITDAPNGAVLLRVDLKGIPTGWHGIHMHQKADCSDGAAGFKASGGHINPDNKEHGLLNPKGPDRADLPNVYAHSDGRVTAELYRQGVSLTPTEENAAINGPYPLLDDDGFAIIIHANADDHRTQPIGGAGPRIACAAIDG